MQERAKDEFMTYIQDYLDQNVRNIAEWRACSFLNLKGFFFRKILSERAKIRWMKTNERDLLQQLTGT